MLVSKFALVRKNGGVLQSGIGAIQRKKQWRKIMKILEAPPFLPARRAFLASLVSFPILLYFCFPGRNINSPALMLGDSDDFIIVNGWVLLKQDIVE